MKDNVFITEESYVGPRGGFGVEDYLIPQKPTTTADVWFEPYQDSAGLSLAGGLSNLSGNQQSETKPQSGLDIDLSGMEQLRQRRSPMMQAAMRGIDLFDMISGIDKNAYLGKTLANEIEYEKKLAEEDPEGYQADVNRAKILSQRAYETDDVELKKKYGAAIKKLLPFETQGMDDLTASGYYTGNEKMEIERLKAATQIAKQKLANEGKENVQELKNASNEQITEMKTATQRDIAHENNAYKEAIANGKYANALQIQEMRNESQQALHELDNETKLRQEYMKQSGANYRSDTTNQTKLAQEGMKQEGQNYRMRENNDAKMDLERLKQEGRMARQELINKGNLERARIAAAAKGKGNTPEKATALQMKVAPERLAQMKKLNESAGRWNTNMYDPNNPEHTWWTRQNVATRKGRDYGISRADNDQDAQDYQRFEGMAKQIVQDQLRLIYGAQFTEKEGERFFQSMGLSPLTDKKVRWSLFMDAVNDLRVKNGYDAIDPDTLEEIPGTGIAQPGNETIQMNQAAQQDSGVRHHSGRRVF